MQLQILTNAHANSESIAKIETGLNDFNRSSSSIAEVEPLHSLATGMDGKVYGGAIGRTWGECCELQLIWVDEEYRGNGIGKLLMDSFENEAVNRGCKLIYLSTFTFQGPLFYEKRGYTEVLRIAGFSGGEEKIHMQKNV